jgi:hypothetical protein
MALRIFTTGVTILLFVVLILLFISSRKDVPIETASSGDNTPVLVGGRETRAEYDYKMRYSMEEIDSIRASVNLYYTKPNALSAVPGNYRNSKY